MIRGKKGWMMGVTGATFLLLVLSYASLADLKDSSCYLEMGVGARPLAMGGASTAVADDATATMWNVAGLSKVESTSVAMMYGARDDLDRIHNFIAAAQSIEGVGTFGLAWINAGVQDIEVWDSIDQKAPTKTYDSSDNAFMLSYGAVFDPVRLGGGIKILSQKLDPDLDETDMGFGGLDIGIMADPVDPVTVGLTVRNIFGKLGDGAIPVQLRVGTALKLLPEENLLLAVDLVKAFVELDDETTDLHMGAEYWAAELIGFRLGVTSRKEFAAGIGVNVSDVLLDYAYSIKRNGADGLEYDSHYVSICASF
jgi:hypothetical protein